MSERAPYDPIAALYDLHWGRQFSAVAREAIDKYLAGRLPNGGRVLDLCCGTGRVLACLSDLGFHASGVDESAEMLAVARRNAPRAELQQADMAGFRFAQSFDAVVSFYNSINHARSFEHLRATTIHVAKYLTTGGFFLFDYVLPEAFENAWEWSEEIDADDSAWTLHYSYEKSTGHATCCINQRDRIRQTAFATHQIREALDEAGLTVVSEEPMTGSLPRGGRRLVFARKL